MQIICVCRTESQNEPHTIFRIECIKIFSAVAKKDDKNKLGASDNAEYSVKYQEIYQHFFLRLQNKLGHNST